MRPVESRYPTGRRGARILLFPSHYNSLQAGRADRSAATLTGPGPWELVYSVLSGHAAPQATALTPTLVPAAVARAAAP